MGQAHSSKPCSQLVHFDKSISKGMCRSPPHTSSVAGTVNAVLTFTMPSLCRAMKVRALLKRGFTLLGCAARYWSADNASTTGAALAFYCAFSIAPLLVILLTIAGFVVSENAVYGQIGAQLTTLFGPATAKILLEAVQSAEHKQGLIATLVSIVSLLVGATTVLAALQAALEVMWRSKVLARTGV